MAMVSTPKAFAPMSSGPVPAAAPAAHVAYERAFRAWSMPSIQEEPAHDASGPLSFQVYTPSDLAQPRPVSLSRIAEESSTLQKKPSMGSRLALVAAGVLTVLGTAGVISFASTDDVPARAVATKSAFDNASTVAPGPAAPPAVTSITTTTALDVAPAPPPVVVVERAAKPVTPVVARPAAPAPAKKSPAPRASSLAPDPWAPGAKDARPAAAPPAPPPNPYGGTPASVLRPPPGFKR